MDEGKFGKSAQRLESVIHRTIADHFEKIGIPYDPAAFLRETSVDFRQLCLEAHFYGADTYPLTPDLATEPS